MSTWGRVAKLTLGVVAPLVLVLLPTTSQASVPVVPPVFPVTASAQANVSATVPRAVVAAGDGLPATLESDTQYTAQVSVWVASNAPKANLAISVTGGLLVGCSPRALLPGQVVQLSCVVRTPSLVRNHGGASAKTLRLVVRIGSRHGLLADRTFAHSIARPTH
jgi:hypothetical protein